MNARSVHINMFEFVHDQLRLLLTVSTMLHADHCCQEDLSVSAAQYCMHKLGLSYLE